MESYISTNRQYKDRLFNFIFGREEHKPWMLDLYNAINHSDYADPNMIEFNTISENLYLGMHNDVSFMIMNEMSVYEHQSTFNPNMPFRQMQYVCNLYEKYILTNKLDKYGKEQIMLPVPKLVVFYNGKADKPEEMVLRLADAFPEELREKSDIQVQVKMLNINYGHNKELMEKCAPLMEYAWLIKKARDYAAEDKETAMDRAVMEMPDDFIIRNFILIHRKEVKKMFLSEYDVDEAIEIAEYNAERRGEERGIKKGEDRGIKIGEEKLRNTIIDLVKSGDLSPNKGAEKLGISIEELKEKLEEM